MRPFALWYDSTTYLRYLSMECSEKVSVTVDFLATATDNRSLSFLLTLARLSSKL